MPFLPLHFPNHGQMCKFYTGPCQSGGRGMWLLHACLGATIYHALAAEPLGVYGATTQYHLAAQSVAYHQDS